MLNALGRVFNRRTYLGALHCIGRMRAPAVSFSIASDPRSRCTRSGSARCSARGDGSRRPTDAADRSGADAVHWASVSTCPPAEMFEHVVDVRSVRVTRGSRSRHERKQRNRWGKTSREEKGKTGVRIGKKEEKSSGERTLGLHVFGEDLANCVPCRSLGRKTALATVYYPSLFSPSGYASIDRRGPNRHSPGPRNA